MIFLTLSRGRPARPNKKILLGGICFFLANSELLYVMKHAELDSAYVFVPASMVVFFGLTAIKYKPNRRVREKVAAAVALAASGMLLSESSGFAVNAQILLIGITLTLTYGIASYAVVVQMLSRPSSEGFWISLTETLLFALYYATAPARPSLQVLIYAFVAAAFLAFGFQLELESVILANSSLRSQFSNLNLVNIIANMDSIVVIVFSIMIGTATPNGALGLLLAFASASILYLS